MLLCNHLRSLVPTFSFVHHHEVTWWGWYQFHLCNYLTMILIWTMFTKKQGNDFQWMGHLYRLVYSRCGWWQNVSWMGVIAKLQLDEVSLYGLSMGELIPCSVLSSPPRVILLFQVPEPTPTTPLRCWSWLTPSIFVDSTVRLPVMGIRVSFNDSKHVASILQGHDLGPHACTTCVCLPTVTAESPTQATLYHATCARSYRESGKWMCRSCCRAWHHWFGVKSILLHVGHLSLGSGSCFILLLASKMHRGIAWH